MIDSSLTHNLENPARVERVSFSILAVVDALSPGVSENYTDMEEWKEKWEINQMIC